MNGGIDHAWDAPGRVSNHGGRDARKSKYDRDGQSVALKAIVSDLTTIDEGVRPLYVKDGEVYKLDVEPVNGFELDNVTGLKNALTSERSIKAGLEGKLKGYEGLDPTSARQAIARLAEFGDLDPTRAKQGLAEAEKFAKFNPEVEADKIAQTKFENAKTQLKADFLNEKTTLTTELEASKSEIGKLKTQIEKSLKTSVIASELAKARPIPEAQDLLEQMAGNAIRLMEVEGEYKPVVVDANGQPRLKLAADYSSVPFTVADLFAEMRDKRAALFQPDDKRGLGTEQSKPSQTATGFDGPNPFAKATFNMTQQMLVMRKDPNLAARLQAEAGA